MQLSHASASRLIPSPRPSASHASFDAVELTGADGASLRVGLVGGQRFYQQRGRSYEDAVAGAQELAAKTGTAQLVIAAHPGLLFVVPAFTRDASTTPVGNAKLGADLVTLGTLAPVGRNGAAWALVGADRVLDLRELPPTLGNGRG